ncbi:hypothetical protein BC826DRAFT_492862 [Russula brevipes]|nr:hypothetical protein BC826DRAFT_492862 [Russula brevipes]
MGIPGDIGIPATDNLRLYLSQATLPLMKIPRTAPRLPPSGHRSHSIGLTTRPERLRRLESVQALGVDVKTEVSKYSNQVVPDYPLDGGDVDSETGTAIRIPCNPAFDIPQPSMIPPTDLDRFASWLDYLPLQATERAMHLVHPKSRDWSFVAQNGDLDDGHFKYFAWEQQATSMYNTSDRNTAAIVMAMPPWTLTPADLHCFATCKEFPLFGETRRAQLNDDQRIWGKLYDICIAKESPYFVVTNYYGWVFGAFSKGWGVARVGEVQEYGGSTPTILEQLLYWVSSSMNEPGTYPVPRSPKRTLSAV